jgi:hypothetical protein
LGRDWLFDRRAGQGLKQRDVVVDDGAARQPVDDRGHRGCEPAVLLEFGIVGLADGDAVGGGQVLHEDRVR